MRYSATINLPGHRFPLTGELDWKTLLMLANNGTDPETVTPRLERVASRIERALRAGMTFTTKTATISTVR